VKNLSCIIFINKKVREFCLNSLQFDGEFYYLPREYFGIKSNLILPIEKKDNKWHIIKFNSESLEENLMSKTFRDDNYTINSYSDDETVISGNKAKINVKIFGSNQNEKAIEHADYLAVENFDEHYIFNALFLDNSKRTLSGTTYQLVDSAITIGRADDSLIRIKESESISRNHAMIVKDNNGNYRIESAKNKANFYVNGLIERSKELKIGDIIQVFDTKILFLQNEIRIYGSADVNLPQTNAVSLLPVRKEKVKKNWFIRTPRIIVGYKSEPVEIDAPPPAQKSKPLPAILQIGPSLTMGLVMLVTLGVSVGNFTSDANLATLISGGALAFSMLIGAILWPLLTRRFQKRSAGQIESLRVNRYNDYIAKIRERLERENYNNRRLLNEEFFPSPEVISRIIIDEKRSRKMFEKTETDDDYLKVRLGSGNVKSAIEIKTAKQGFSVDQDLLLKLPGEIANEFSFIDDMPVAISLKVNKSIGLIGSQEYTDNLIKSIFMSLTFGHSYDEVKTVFIYRDDQRHKFEAIHKTQHIKTDNGENRLVASTKEEVHRLFNFFTELIDRQRQTSDKNKPFFVFFIFDRELLDGQPFARKLENPKEDDNFCAIFSYNSIYKLPKECRIIIQADRPMCGFYSKENNANHFQEFVPDTLNPEYFLEYINYLQNVRVKIEQKIAGVPDKVSFLGLYKAGNIESLNIKKRWDESCSYKSLAAPIGIKSGGEVFSLNVHEAFHGPHGLAAGMTGSGKSELLQACILSLAINFHPDDVSFILIDYKGGGMANAFDGMPHLAGKITNLSGSTLRRSLISIDAELKRRQGLFAAAGVNNIDKYQKLFKEGKLLKPLPHLLIIADEFAQLKSQQPEFMRKIIDIAQIGRSLGIHLLLATQKPAGVVDDQIWGNSRFRMCLKVLEKQDSQEMIKKPDAAFIKLPGRCYVQVGYDEVYEYLQSGYSGAPYIPTEEYQDDEENSLSWIDSFGNTQKTARLKTSAQKDNLTQLEALVNYFSEIARKDKINPNLLWLEPLKEQLYLNDIVENKNFNGQSWINDKICLKTCIGFADYPETQEQKPLYLDLNRGNAAVYGTSSSGKTTFLQTALLSLAINNSPGSMFFYLFDFGSRVLGCFGKMPHVKALHFSDDAEQIAKTMTDLTQIIAERQRLFGQAGVTSFESYNQSVKTKAPAIIIVIDNYSIVTERFSSVMGDPLIKIAREGAAYGVYLIVTGSNKSAVFYRVSDFINNNFALRQNDLSAYRDILKIAVQVEPEEIAGRGITVVDKQAIEFQTALPVSAESEAARTAQIKTLAEAMCKKGVRTTEKAAAVSIKKEKEDKISLTKLKTLVITDFAKETADTIVSSMLKDLEMMDSTIFVYNTAGNYALKGAKTIGLDIYKLRDTDDSIVLINGFMSFYEMISDEEAMLLTDYTVSEKGNNTKFILIDTVDNLNTMTLTPLFNNLTRDKKMTAFLVGDVQGARETVFEAIIRGRKSIAEGEFKMFFVDSDSSNPVNKVRFKQ